MTVHNLGSINIDHFLNVPALPRAGETVLSSAHVRQAGGKGLNMSVALARAGVQVYHYGGIGEDGRWLLDAMKSDGINADGVRILPGNTGSAMVCVDGQGENLIVVNPGTNRSIGDSVQLLDKASPDDWALVQNETDGQAAFVKRTRELGLKVAYAAAPFDLDATLAILEYTDALFVNEIEAAQLTQALGCRAEDLGPQWVVVTLGSRGARVYHQGDVISRPADPTRVVDTTAAGDTYTGYFLAGLTQGLSLEQTLSQASRAAAWCVAHRGAAQSIPKSDQL